MLWAEAPHGHGREWVELGECRGDQATGVHTSQAEKDLT